MRYNVPALSQGPPEDRVTIRGHREDDAEGVYEQCVDPLTQAWTTVPVPYTRDNAKRFVREVMPGGWQTDQEWGFAVDVDSRYAGTVSLRNEREGRAEIAYASHPCVRGTGVMERALRLLLAWGFEERDLHTVIWWSNRGNFASRKLAWRLGFAVEGLVRDWLPQRGELLDAWVGTLLATDERRPRHRWIDVPTIESPRLPIRLRAARDKDAPRIVEGCADASTTHWLGFLPQPFTAADAQERLRTLPETMASGRGLHLVVADSSDDRLLGFVGLVDLDPAMRSAELGYWLHPDARGRGVMTEAVRMTVRHALLPEDVGGLGLVRVLAHAAADNRVSHTVLTRAGLAEAGLERMSTRTRAGLQDAVRYERLATDPPTQPCS